MMLPVIQVEVAWSKVRWLKERIIILKTLIWTQKPWKLCYKIMIYFRVSKLLRRHLKYRRSPLVRFQVLNSNWSRKKSLISSWGNWASTEKEVFIRILYSEMIFYLISWVQQTRTFLNNQAIFQVKLIINWIKNCNLRKMNTVKSWQTFHLWILRHN